MVANDLANDQSYYLSRLDSNLLSGLILPLSEIRKEEVIKIADLLKVDYISRDKSNRGILMHDPRLIPLIEARVPKDLKRPGNLYRYIDDSNYGEHNGIHHYYIGKKNLKFRQDLQVDPEIEVISIVPFKSNVFLGYQRDCSHKNAFITKFSGHEGLDKSVPIHCYVKKGPNDVKFSCILYFKNNRCCVVEYAQAQPGLLIAGQFLVFYSREGAKGKIIGSGVVEFGGTFANNEFNTLPSKIKKDEDEPEEELIPDENLYF
jgi:tRNA U34 2-thiouridine synthase MnmA/TrmU